MYREEKPRPHPFYRFTTERFVYHSLVRICPKPKTHGCRIPKLKHESLIVKVAKQRDLQNSGLCTHNATHLQGTTPTSSKNHNQFSVFFFLLPLFTSSSSSCKNYSTITQSWSHMLHCLEHAEQSISIIHKSRRNRRACLRTKYLPNVNSWL